MITVNTDRTESLRLRKVVYEGDSSMWLTIDSEVLCDILVDDVVDELLLTPTTSDTELVSNRMREFLGQQRTL